MVEPSRAWVWAALGVLGALALVQALRSWLRSAAERWRAAARMRRARAGERAAEPLLERAGYRVRGRQVQAELEYRVDGVPHAVVVRADYVVERDGRPWVAEVKTGDKAPRLSTPATRRQLLEYGHAFGGAGVLLVDPERGRVHAITLPDRPGARAPRAPRELAILFFGIAIGAIAAWAALS